MRKTPKEIRKTLKEHYHKKNGCEGKRKYLDESSAQSRAAYDKQRFKGHKRKGEEAHRPYRCVFCTYWHIGTPTNPNYRQDFKEVVEKAQLIHAGVPIFRPERNLPRPDLSSLYLKGLLKKENLIHGEYYIGYCKFAVVARWHSENGLFYYQTDGRENSRPHPADDIGGDIFTPVDKIQPTRNQRVYEAFGEAHPIERPRFNP